MLDKFEDCQYCKWRNEKEICDDCEVGEEFEDALEDEGLRLDYSDTHTEAAA